MRPVDIEQAQRFLTLLDEGAEAFAFRTVGATGENHSGTLDALAAKLALANGRGDGVYVVVNAGGQDTASITRVRAVFADCDTPGAPWPECPLDPHIIVESSPGKWHAYWLVDGLPLEMFGSVQRAIAARFATDPSVIDLPRIMRLPGFMHTKGEPFQTRIIHESGAVPYSAAAILAEFPPAAATPPKAQAPAVHGMIPDGERDTTLTSLAGSMRRRGMSEVAMLAALRVENETRCAPPLDDAQVVKIARSIGRKEPAPQAKPAPADTQGAAATVTFTRADQIEFKPTAWLIDGWLVRDTLAGLVAPSGAGKSFLAIDWACRVATGADWYGRGVEKGAVFYLAGEGQQGLRKRIAAWEKHFTVSIQGAPLFLAESLPFLCDDITTEGVVTAIEKVADALFSESGVKPSLIVIDTVARAMSGANENSAEDMGQFVRSLDRIRRQWGCTVLTVHHTGHDKEAQDRARGSSAYRAALDSEFVLKPDGVDVAVRATKCKDWRTPSPLGLTKVEVELLLPQPDGTQLKESSLVLHDAPGAIAESARRDRVIALHREGKSQREIAELTKTPKTTVQRWLKAA